MRSSGRVRTCFTVSISLPWTTFYVLQAASPLRSFLREIGSSCEMSSLLFGGKRSSMSQKRCRVICRLSVGPPCVIPIKSSRYTSTCARAVTRACGYRSSQFLSESFFTVASSSEVCGGLVSAKYSRWCGGAVWRVEMVSSVLSLTVSVVAQKKAADSTYSMDIDRWNHTSWSSLGVTFGTRNSTDGMSSRRTHMRMYASTRSTLLSKVGTSLGGAARMQSIILWSYFPKRIASLWDTWVTALLSPLQETL